MWQGSVWQGLVRYATKKKKSSRCIFSPCRASAAGVLLLQRRTTSKLSPYKFTTNTDTNIEAQIQIQILKHKYRYKCKYKCIFSSAAGFCL